MTRAVAAGMALATGIVLTIMARRAGPLRLPGPASKVGLGDAIKHATSSVGIRPCDACRERADRLNRLATFGGPEIEMGGRREHN